MSIRLSHTGVVINYGDKVTLRDYRAIRWQREHRTPEPNDHLPRWNRYRARPSLAAAIQPIAYLMSSPVNMERDSLRDRVPFSDKTLASRCRKFLTLSAVFQRPNLSPFWEKTSKHPIYPAWCGTDGRGPSRDWWERLK